ncbi:hypothetical protein LXL04_016756 [Taraxacum kok-saghyz]
MSNHNNIKWYINNYNECQTTTYSLLDEYLLKDKSEQSDAVSSYPEKEAVKGSNDIYVLLSLLDPRFFVPVPAEKDAAIFLFLGVFLETQKGPSLAADAD